MNAPKYLENTAVEYPIRPNNLIGKVNDFGRYDLENVIIVNLSNVVVQDTEGLYLHRLLETLLSPKIRPDEKAEILTHEYDVKITDTMERRLNIMCNLSEAIEEEARAKAIAEAEAEAKARAKETALEMLHDGLPRELILKYSRLTEEDLSALEEQACTTA